MERNRPVTIFSVITILLVCVAAVLASFSCVPDHPIKTSLLGLAVIFGALAVITGVHFMVFVPLFMIISKLHGRNQTTKDAGQP